LNKHCGWPMALISLFFMLPCVVGCADNGFLAPDKNAYGEQLNIGIRPVENTRYRILPGDDLEIKQTYHPNFSERLEVLPDGWINLPLIGSIQASGKQPEALAEELRALYAKELKEPEVIVMVRHSNGRLVYIGGEVKLPRALPLTFPTTLFQAVIQCGDILPTAHEDNVLILRATPGASPEVIMADLDLIRNGEAPDIELQPYDIVHIPKTTIAKAGDFIDAYINRIVPKNVNFPFFYELHNEEGR